jgi:nucleoside-diphosphate-sugar epimerase
MKKLSNLVIGNTSQLSFYFPTDYVKISSRAIPDLIFKQQWDTVFICFAEQRTYLTEDDSFEKINFDYTLSVIERISANKIVYYSTAELWNNYNGEINTQMQFSYHNSGYLRSKQMITEHLKSLKLNIIIIFPFNFNSIHRNPPFLFGKVFDSIINKKKICIGDTYFYRDLLHPSDVVMCSIETNEDIIVGGGSLIFVNDFIRELYSKFNLKYENYVEEDLSQKSIYRQNIFYSKHIYPSNKSKLLNKIVNEIKTKI